MVAINQILDWADYTAGLFTEPDPDRLGCIHLKPLDWRGSRLGFYLPLDEVSLLPNKSVANLAEVVSGRKIVSICCQSLGSPSAPSTIKFGNGSVVFKAGGFTAIPLPYNSAYSNKTDFTYRGQYKCSSVTGTTYLIGEYIAVNGGKRWYLARIGTELSFSVFNNAGGTAAVTTSGLGLTIGVTYEIEFSFYGSDPAALYPAVIKVNGSVVKVPTNTSIVIATPEANEHCVLDLGGIYYDHVTYGGYPNYSEDEAVVNEWAMTPTYNADAYTSAIARLLPFTNGAVAVSKKFDSGVAGATWDLSGFHLLDETGVASLKFRAWSGGSGDPEYSGDKLTYAQLQAVGTIAGRYFQWEATFETTGLVDVVCPPAYIPLTASATPPGKPVVDSFTRNGVTGTAVISGMAATDTVYVFAKTKNANTKKTLGSRTGNGSVTLDFSTYVETFEDQNYNFAVDCYAQGKVGTLWGETGESFGFAMIGFWPEACTLTYVRGVTTATFAVAGLATGDVIMCAYLPPAGDTETFSINANGTTTLTGLDKFWKYAFDFIHNKKEGTVGLIKLVGDFSESVPAEDLPVIEKILDDIEDTLNDIKTTNHPIGSTDNYRVDVGQVERKLGTPMTGAAFPYIAFGEILSSPGMVIYPRQERELVVGISGWVQDDEQAKQANVVAAEVERALMGDPARNSNAIYTKVATGSATVRLIGRPNGVPQPFGVFKTEVRVRFRHNWKDPFKG